MLFFQITCWISYRQSQTAKLANAKALTGTLPFHHGTHSDRKLGKDKLEGMVLQEVTAIRKMRVQKLRRSMALVQVR